MQHPAAKPLQPQRAPEKLTPQQVAEGLHVNRVQVHLSGNMHFPGWWEVVPKDTSVVIAQGAGYKGRSVIIGGQKFENAAAIHVNPNAGFNETANLHILGKAGEEVRVVYIRTGPNATIHEANGEVTIANVGQGAMVGGDAHRRDVKLTIRPGTGADAVQGGSFVRYLPDHYGWSQQGSSTTSLGGGANAYSATSQYVEPMFAPGHGPGSH